MVEIEELKEQAGIVDNLEDAAELIKKYEEILRTKSQGIISVANYQGKSLVGFERRKSL